MAPVLLNIAPALRPWRYAGVSRLLVDEATAVRLRTPPGREKAPDTASAPDSPRAPSASQLAPAGQSPQTPPGRQEQAGRPVFTAQPASGAQSTSGAQPVRPVRPAPPPRPEQAKAPVQGQPSPLEDREEIALLPLSQWAPFWRDLLQKTPPRPVLLWTYPGLDRDLSGEADTAHRHFLRRLLADIALPKGSHAFWPLTSWPPKTGETLDANGERQAHASHFMSGVVRLDPRTVLFMTGTPPGGLGLSHLRPLQPAIAGGRRYVVTPHVETLIQEPGRYSQLISFLKALLNQGM